MAENVSRDRPGRPFPAVGQWWALNGNEGVITKILPGGADNRGIAVFDGDIPPAHINIMLRFDAWKYIAKPSRAPLPPPCTCVHLDGGVILSDGCAAHSAPDAIAATVDDAPQKPDRKPKRVGPRVHMLGPNPKETPT